MNTRRDPKHTWRTKWRFIAAYWVLQAAAFHLVTLTFFSAESVPDQQRSDVIVTGVRAVTVRAAIVGLRAGS